MHHLSLKILLAIVAPIIRYPTDAVGYFTNHNESHALIEAERRVFCTHTEDPALIHQVIAPAGSTLLFGEALIHATGRIRSDRERVIIIGGYTPPMFQAWHEQEPSADFVARTPTALQPLVSGSDKWHWERRFRTLGMPLAQGK